MKLFLSQIVYEWHTYVQWGVTVSFVWSMGLTCLMWIQIHSCQETRGALICRGLHDWCASLSGMILPTLTMIIENLWSVHTMTMPCSQSCQCTHWIRVPLPLLRKFLLQDFLISASFKIWGLKFHIVVHPEDGAACYTHLPDYIES
jgi:hypothetical protein